VTAPAKLSAATDKITILEVLKPFFLLNVRPLCLSKSSCYAIDDVGLALFAEFVQFIAMLSSPSVICTTAFAKSVAYWQQ
jgi:hypothetical protein